MAACRTCISCGIGVGRPAGRSDGGHRARVTDRGHQRRRGSPSSWRRWRPCWCRPANQWHWPTLLEAVVVDPRRRAALACRGTVGGHAVSTPTGRCKRSLHATSILGEGGLGDASLPLPGRRIVVSPTSSCVPRRLTTGSKSCRCCRRPSDGRTTAGIGTCSCGSTSATRSGHRSPGWSSGKARIVAVRLFMRWDFVRGGTLVHAVRAVDTATHPDHQGGGLFSELTWHTLEMCRSEGVAFVFNTPNAESRPGYLKLGWRELGRPATAVRRLERTRLRFGRAESRAGRAMVRPARGRRRDRLMAGRAGHLAGMAAGVVERPDAADCIRPAICPLALRAARPPLPCCRRWERGDRRAPAPPGLWPRACRRRAAW